MNDALIHTSSYPESCFFVPIIEIISISFSYIVTWRIVAYISLNHWMNLKKKRKRLMMIAKINKKKTTLNRNKLKNKMQHGCLLFCKKKYKKKTLWCFIGWFIHVLFIDYYCLSSTCLDTWRCGMSVTIFNNVLL